jgi:mannitol/fructose-specific phosphotransferase system IIA component
VIVDELLDEFVVRIGSVALVDVILYGGPVVALLAGISGQLSEHLRRLKRLIHGMRRDAFTAIADDTEV